MKNIFVTLRHGALDLAERFAPVGQSCVAGLREVASGVIDHLETIPRSLAASTTTVLLAFSLGALLLFSASCAHTLQGVERPGPRRLLQRGQLLPHRRHPRLAPGVVSGLSVQAAMSDLANEQDRCLSGSWYIWLVQMAKANQGLMATLCESADESPRFSVNVTFKVGQRLFSPFALGLSLEQENGQRPKQRKVTRRGGLTHRASIFVLSAVPAMILPIFDAPVAAAQLL